MIRNLFLHGPCYGQKLMILMQLLSFFYPVLFAVDPDCNYDQNMEINVNYYVYNNEYPGYYGPNRNCFWKATAPAGYKVEASCELEIPSTNNCQMDKVLISLTGSSNLENAQVYCGYGNTGTMETAGNVITIGLQSGYNTGGGRFVCTIRTKKADPPPCDCGWKNTRRIVGGIETKVNEFPMMAGLIDFIIRDLFCGGTVIATRYVLSAAHCFKNLEASNVGVLVGDHNLTSGSETGAARLHRVERWINHPMYDPNDQLGRNDISVVRTATLIEFNLAVGPACLPFTHYLDSFAGQSVEALGWGTTEFTGPKSDVLLKTDLNVLAYNKCYDDVGGTVDQMCTFKQGHDSCQSDSGGPLLWMDTTSGRINLVGVISSGYGCASSRPALNTRVTSYINWITSVTPDASYCIK